MRTFNELLLSAESRADLLDRTMCLIWGDEPVGEAAPILDMIPGDDPYRVEDALLVAVHAFGGVAGPFRYDRWGEPWKTVEFPDGTKVEISFHENGSGSGLRVLPDPTLAVN